MCSLTLLTLIGYLLLVRALRFKRRDSYAARYGFTDRASFGRMTLQEAFGIQLLLAELEFPTIFSVSIFVALFKTYGIPAISELLVATGELSEPERSSKRAADTGVLLTEFILNKPGSDRNLGALARINWVHDRYRKAGKIRDEDMLYTLGLFALEPIRWTDRFEWRRVTDVERCAMAVYWRQIGEAMGIPYEPLRSSRSGWQDGLHWLEELEAWSLAYEVANVVPAKSNVVLAQATVDIGLTNGPKIFHGTAKQFVAALLDKRLRTAMPMENPPYAYAIILNSAAAVRAWLVRTLFLPRPGMFRVRWFSQRADTMTGRYHAEHYIGHPWYSRPSATHLFSPKTWFLWICGGYVASWKQPQYRPEGYRISDLGPVSLEGKGLADIDAQKLRISSVLLQCPISRSSKSTA